MVLDGVAAVFLAGSAGGLAAELLHWYQLRESPNLPKYAASRFYWAVTGLMIVAGGVLAAFYGTEAVSAMLAANVGASAPLVIRAAAQSTPPPPPAPPSDWTGGGAAIGAVARRTDSLVDFLAGR